MRARIFALGPACLAVACAAAAAPPAVPTVPLVQIATGIEEYRGQMVRICGPRSTRLDGGRAWQLSVPRAFGHHAAGVVILGCPQLAAAGGEETCVTGRIARRDGSIEPDREGRLRVVSSAAISEEWFLHAQCPARAAQARLEQPGT
jgi:hypothetical protein